MFPMLGPTLFRASAFSFFIFVCGSMHNFILPKERYSTETFALLTPYLTFLVLNVIYYISANALQITGSKVVHGALFCVTFSMSLLVCLMFWALFLYDKELLVKSSKIDVLPMWFHHAAHTAGPFLNLIDAILWRPYAPFFPSLVLLSAFAGGYIYLLEHLIRFHQFYPYPILQNLSDHDRFVFYGVCLFLSLLCLFVAHTCTSLLSPSSKAITAKEKTNANNAAAPATGARSATGRPKKLRKAD
ncbi:hypothetical protein FBUS_05840 [Fasciolopsis buskii]|uniref:Uncharacterized protein n=1 Tax=Fasciolopsis buskii TaxID=27845 RepID=A0A8E0SAW3_9TREM|nr:hypothetical protein FBUS_05840 [Fasciolopsis buski]